MRPAARSSSAPRSSPRALTSRQSWHGSSLTPENPRRRSLRRRLVACTAPGSTTSVEQNRGRRFATCCLLAPCSDEARRERLRQTRAVPSASSGSPARTSPPRGDGRLAIGAAAEVTSELGGVASSQPGCLGFEPWSNGLFAPRRLVRDEKLGNQPADLVAREHSIAQRNAREPRQRQREPGRSRIDARAAVDGFGDSLNELIEGE